MTDTLDEVQLEVPEDQLEELANGQDDQEDETAEGEEEELPFLDIDQFRNHRVTVKVDGEDIEVPLSEAVAGFSRQADYTRKTQELAQQRAELQWATAIRGALDNDPAGTLELLKAHYGLQSPAQPQAVDDPLFDDSWDEPVNEKYREIDQRLRRFEEEQATSRLQNESAGCPPSMETISTHRRLWPLQCSTAQPILKPPTSRSLSIGFWPARR